MKKSFIFLLMIVFALILVGAGCSYQASVKRQETNQQNGNVTQEQQNKTTLSCEKESNCCVENTDCKYVWFTGGCNTSEYIAKMKKEFQKQGKLIGEAPPRENVTCTCENNECIIHN